MVAFSFINKSKSKTEIREAYEELQNIADDLSKSDESGKIKEIVSNFAGQIVDGFAAAFKQSSDEDLIKFMKVKKQIVISNQGRGPSSWRTKEKFIGIIQNKSNYPIASINVNLSCYSKENELIDSKTTWISNIKILSPNEEVSFAIERDLGDNSLSNEELKKNKAHSFKISIRSFDIRELNKMGLTKE